ncbi:excisionase [Intrasporangium oryzae NRRL B-24470]|uniref:citrate synthase (unknown stereospecificity) n=1 Tax=Intrasporangium oryzae NRRL B-24470 TaxID=1386089 RepID=W9G434_9MICO|nr:citrate/2-methylcitrate synthase [Intrasporangium oryzae]EWT00911.1 excisionase [Intrasporangium oryzae NRRL B-24470]
MSGPAGQWITTTEAAQRLGVKRATLYAYVSRGLLHSERRPGQQESLFDRAQIDAMAAATRPSGTPQPVLRFRSVASSVSTQVDGELFYRGVPLAEVVATTTLEEAAALVVGAADAAAAADVGRATPTTPPAPVRRLIERLPLERRIPVAVQVLAADDPWAADLDPDRVRASALPTIRAATSLISAAGPGPEAARGDLAATLLAGLRAVPGSPAEVDAVRVLLTSLLDHGLTASTIAARVAASTRAGVHDCLTAAYAAMAGPLHGAAPIAAHHLLADERRPEAAIAAAIRERGHVPGFGHFLYPAGDPRADVVLETVWRLPGTGHLRRRVDALAMAVRDRTGDHPNIDLASAALLHALDLPAAAGEVAFQVARSFGVVAHVLEEYAEQPLRWRGREAIG